MSPHDPGLSRSSANLLLLVCAAIWGLAFLFQKSATAHLGPVTFVALRALAATITLAPFALWERQRAGDSVDVRHRPLTIATGAVFLVSAVLQQWGMESATVTNTGLLTGLYVVATPLMTWLLLGQRPSRRLWVAVLLATAGLFLLGGGGIAGLGSGDRLVAIAAVLWGLYVVLLGMASAYGAPIQRTTLQLATVAVLGAVGALQFETTAWAAIERAALDILFVGVVSTALTFTLFTIAVRWTSPVAAAIIVSTETLFAAAAGYLVLGERLPPLGWAGAALMILAVIWVQLPARTNADTA
jgi:drug/metabolite transporter (DMT)-like permease